MHYLLLFSATILFRVPQCNLILNRGEIVVLKAPDEPNVLYIKRVIGMPGDSIRFQNDRLYINGRKYKETYLNKGKKLYSMGSLYTENFTLQSKHLGKRVPRNCYFVMGDHRSVSVDSRSASVGCVAYEQVVGKLRLRIWPLGSFGALNVRGQAG